MHDPLCKLTKFRFVHAGYKRGLQGQMRWSDMAVDSKLEKTWDIT